LSSGTRGCAVCISVCLTSLTPCTFNSWEKWFLRQAKILRARTHQQSPFQSSPVRLTRRGSDCVAYLQWPPRQCVHNSRVESSHTSIAESRVLMPHASFSWDTSDRAGRKKWM
jgi:hypothetical protein